MGTDRSDKSERSKSRRDRKGVEDEYGAWDLGKGHKVKKEQRGKDPYADLSEAGRNMKKDRSDRSDDRSDRDDTNDGRTHRQGDRNGRTSPRKGRQDCDDYGFGFRRDPE